MQENIFEKHKKVIDALLAKECGDVLDKIPAIYDRLAQNDPEAISQALTTCRRMINSFADNVYLPQREPIQFAGQEMSIDKEHPLNRLRVFISNNTESDSVREKLNKRLRLLYDRVSTAVHHEVNSEEAQFLFLETYLLLGEIINLSDNKKSGKKIE